MKKIFIFSLLLYLLPCTVFGYGTCGTVELCPTTVGQTEWTAASASYANVNYCVNTCATYGDVVNVPAGDVTWASSLYIRKYMTLSGAGSDAAGTNITQGINDQHQYLIKYEPDSASVTANGLFRITGFSFDGTCDYFYTGDGFDYTTSGGIFIKSDQKTKYLTNLRIDHNKFTRFRAYDYSQTENDGMYSDAVIIWGLWGGVVDNNHFYSTKAVRTHGSLWGAEQWVNWTRDLGSANTVYFEDNLFEECDQVANGGNGGSRVLRFNEIRNQVKAVIFGSHYAYSYVWDPTVASTTRRGDYLNEIYQNKFDMQSGSAWLANAYAGKWAVWGNRQAAETTTTFAINLRCRSDEAGYAPSLVTRGGVTYQCKLNHTAGASTEPGVGGSWATYWTTTITNTKIGPTAWTSGRAYVKSPGYDPVQTSYFWDNKMNSGVYIAPTNRNTNTIVANRDYWGWSASFNGTSGVGSGLRSARPATCTTGVAYWSTDDTTDWNKSAGTGTGDTAYHNPLGYVADGALDKCTATNTWTDAWYVPYEYPHPLRAETPTDTTAPTIGDDWTPTGTLVCSADPLVFDMTISTNETATCKWDTSDTTYALMANTFDHTTALNHTAHMSLACGSAYTRYARCQDTATNESTTKTITFTIQAGPGDVTAPVISSIAPQGEEQCTSDPRTSTLSLTCADNVACTACKADLDNVDIDDMDITLTQSGTSWSGTTGNLACGSSNTYYAKCEDAADNETAATTIAFTVEAAPACRVGYWTECTTQETCEAIDGIWEVTTPAFDQQIPTGLDYLAGGWTPTGAASNYEAIDDPYATPDDDTTYMSNTGTQAVRFLHTNATTITTVSKIVVTIRARNTTGTGTMRAHLRVPPSTYYGTSFSVGTDYTDYVTEWALNPKTGIAWTVNDLEALSDNDLWAYGCEALTVSGEARVTQIKLEVQGEIAGCVPEEQPPTDPSGLSLSGGVSTGGKVQ